jgi:hypothetical protein
VTAKLAAGDGWTRVEHLLFMVVDELRVANWQRRGKRSNRPKPISPLAKKGKRYGHTDRSPEEVAAYLARFDPAHQRAA